MSVPQAKVWNDNTLSYTERFKDQEITIPAKGYVILEKPEAVQFIGQYVPIRRDALGKDLNPKKLRLEVISNEEANEALKYKCMQCGHQGASEKDLTLHVEANHVDQLADEKVREEIKKKGK